MNEDLKAKCVSCGRYFLPKKEEGEDCPQKAPTILLCSDECFKQYFEAKVL